MNYSLPGSSVQGILQAGLLVWVAISSSRVSSWPKGWTCISCLGRQILYHWDTWEAHQCPQFSSVAQSCLTLCHPMNRSTPGLPVHDKLPEFTQTHAHRVGDAIQPSHPLSSPSPPVPNPCQHQGLFQWVNSSHEVAKVVEFQLQHECLVHCKNMWLLCLIAGILRMLPPHSHPHFPIFWVGHITVCWGIKGSNGGV